VFTDERELLELELEELGSDISKLENKRAMLEARLHSIDQQVEMFNGIMVSIERISRTIVNMNEQLGLQIRYEPKQKVAEVHMMNNEYNPYSSPKNPNKADLSKIGKLIEELLRETGRKMSVTEIQQKIEQITNFQWSTFRVTMRDITERFDYNIEKVGVGLYAYREEQAV
jgi:hypothetical protein